MLPSSLVHGKLEARCTHGLFVVMRAGPPRPERRHTVQGMGGAAASAMRAASTAASAFGRANSVYVLAPTVRRPTPSIMMG